MLNEFKAFKTEPFLYGVCYYPEHWDESLWDDDFRRIKATGMNVVRLGESAWNIWEPEEGVYFFELFDRAIQLCRKYDLKVILGTPSYAPPAWLTEKYPEVLRADFKGNLMQHGSRRHNNYTSSVYLDLCKKIVMALIEHYKDHTSVLGWQIDNEFNCHMDVSFAESDHFAFRQWCMDKYGQLDALNDAWGTRFWAQTYTDWGQVYLPRSTVTYHNPGHLLDFYRFTSDATIAFAKLQYDIIKDRNSAQFVTHNGLFENIDNYKLTEQSLDFMSFDSYPAFGLMWRKDLPLHFRDRIYGMRLSRVRGMSAKFLILEQQAGAGGQSGSILQPHIKDYMHYTPKPGQMRLWSWQSIAHGADGILFFRWRTCTVGSETLWHGLNDYGNQANRRLDEAAKLGEELKQLGPLLVESSCQASAALLYDYDNDSNCKIEGYIGPNLWRSEEAIYQSLSERHILTDQISNQCLERPEFLSRYKLLFYANAQLLNEEDVIGLKHYVENGGTLVLGPRSGYKDRNNRCYMLPFPGIVKELAGIEVEEFTMVDEDEPIYMEFQLQKKKVLAPVFNEVIKLLSDDSTIIAKYSNGYYSGLPAVVSTPLGKGKVIYFGAFFTMENTNMLLDSLEIKDPISVWAEVPAEIEVIPRVSKNGEFAIFLNYMNKPMCITLHKSLKNLLTDEWLLGELKIVAYGVLVLQISSVLEDRFRAG
ncbi:beta-galactosidase [Paenibacillus psychroresistens]|nr:beta-galactosidase [Paenibacillus psychroresistens]